MQGIVNYTGIGLRFVAPPCISGGASNFSPPVHSTARARVFFIAYHARGSQNRGGHARMNAEQGLLVPLRSPRAVFFLFFFSRPRSEAWPHHFSIWLDLLCTRRSTGCTVRHFFDILNAKLCILCILENTEFF